MSAECRIGILLADTAVCRMGNVVLFLILSQSRVIRDSIQYEARDFQTLVRRVTFYGVDTKEQICFLRLTLSHENTFCLGAQLDTDPSVYSFPVEGSSHTAVYLPDEDHEGIEIPLSTRPSGSDKSTSDKSTTAIVLLMVSHESGDQEKNNQEATRQCRYKSTCWR
jgi:hypothetical protein